jgi:hypothetical protein
MCRTSNSKFFTDKHNHIDGTKYFLQTTKSSANLKIEAQYWVPIYQWQRTSYAVPWSFGDMGFVISLLQRR